MNEASKGHRVSQAQPYPVCPDYTHTSIAGVSQERWDTLGMAGELTLCLTWENVTMGPKG